MTLQWKDRSALNQSFFIKLQEHTLAPSIYSTWDWLDITSQKNWGAWVAETKEGYVFALPMAYKFFLGKKRAILPLFTPFLRPLSLPDVSITFPDKELWQDFFCFQFSAFVFVRPTMASISGVGKRLVFDCTIPPETRWEGYKSEIRRRIRFAKKEYEVRFATQNEDFPPEVYQNYIHYLSKKGAFTSTHERDIFLQLQKHYSLQNERKLLIVKHIPTNKDIAFSFAASHRDEYLALGRYIEDAHKKNHVGLLIYHDHLVDFYNKTRFYDIQSGNNKSFYEYSRSLNPIEEEYFTYLSYETRSIYSTLLKNALWLKSLISRKK